MAHIDLSETMTRAEKRAASGLAAIFGLRMLGMFLILPVFALYAEHLPGGDNHTLVGLALGMYGLTQAILMIPFGMASDRIGRKKVIIFGLVVFALGSFVAAAATDIYWTIFGRALQGAGAGPDPAQSLTELAAVHVGERQRLHDPDRPGGTDRRDQLGVGARVHRPADQRQGGAGVGEELLGEW